MSPKRRRAVVVGTAPLDAKAGEVIRVFERSVFVTGLPMLVTSRLQYELEEDVVAGTAVEQNPRTGRVRPLRPARRTLRTWLLHRRYSRMARRARRGRAP